jgi:hypothetical protein
MTSEHETLEHPGDVEPEAHGIGDHGEEHGHDDHGHGSETLGPVDVAAWGAFALGTGLGLAVAFCIAVATGDLPG